MHNQWLRGSHSIQFPWSSSKREDVSLSCAANCRKLVQISYSYFLVIPLLFVCSWTMSSVSTTTIKMHMHILYGWDNGSCLWYTVVFDYAIWERLEVFRLSCPFDYITRDAYHTIWKYFGTHRLFHIAISITKYIWWVFNKQFLLIFEKWIFY